jgi:hypothetical protein
MIVQVALVFGRLHAHGKHPCNDVLGRGLARAPGYRYHAASPLAARPGCELLQCAKGVFDAQLDAGRVSHVFDNCRRGALLEYVSHILVPVMMGPPQSKVQIAGFERARVD